MGRSSSLIHVVPARHPGHSSDSEDQSRIASLPHKTHKSRPAASSSSSPPSHGKDGKHSSSPQRMYKWTLQLGKLLPQFPPLSAHLQGCESLGVS